MFWRAMSVLVIALTLVVNVFAVTALLDAWEIADTAWKPELYQLGKIYVVPIVLLSRTIDGPITSFLSEWFTLPCWWIHLFAIYGASAGAIWAGTMSVDERSNRISEIKRGGASIFFPLAIIGYIGSLIMQGFRNRVVSTFLAKHTGTALLYTIAVFGLYAAANWANANYLDGPPYPGQEVELKNATPCPVVPVPTDEELAAPIALR
ncbi:hypothetical protein HK107_14810 [Parvularcula sp. ZS-1/3]|uniref:Uncharacterized protein n=1 Tax=Parvularcula mediterranea TaxID=2732508 RepID=A0A7Y3W690_9PROT|nr:hypothetical protein [Parvularcula mediterranea]NNU17600.1 hypothetical protein [Parvularcula mediterranea]